MMSLVTLDLLPTEILLHIFDFLNARFLSQSLSCVCKRFHELIDDQLSWKARIYKKFPGKYPPIPGLASTLNWRQVCISREEDYELWSTVGSHSIQFTSLPHIHNGDIHALHIIPEHPSLLTSASRDRGFCLWNLNNLPDNQEGSLIYNKTDAHGGWIWCLASEDSQLFSGSFDDTIKTWDLETYSQIQTFTCKAPVLSIASKGDQLFGGTTGCLHRFDRRSLDHQQWKTLHKQYVFSLVVEDNWILSASQDRTVKALDLRNNKVFFNHKFNKYPTSLSYGHGQIWIGDEGGNIHLIDPVSWKYILKVPKVSNNLIRVQHSLGSIVTYSEENISILEPTVEGSLIRKITMPRVVAAMTSYKNNLLVANQECIKVIANVKNE